MKGTPAQIHAGAADANGLVAIPIAQGGEDERVVLGITKFDGAPCAAVIAGKPN